VAYLHQRLRARADEGIIARVDVARMKISRCDFLGCLQPLIASVKQRPVGEHAIFVLDQYSYDAL